MTMKKILVTALITLLLLCACSGALALSDYMVVSDTDTLNLRQGPGVDYAWLGSAVRGDWVYVTGESGNWFYCTIVKSGLSGYMSKNFLSAGSQGSSTRGVVNNPVSTQFLNLREYPSYSAPVLGIYYNGTYCNILSTSNGWHYVEVGGVYGYFRTEFISTSAIGTGASSDVATISTPNGGTLNMRGAPSSNASVVGRYNNGRVVSVILRGNGYYKVQIDGAVGYMDTSFLKAGGAVPVNPVNPKPSTKGYCIVNNPRATQVLNLRAQPSSSAKVIAQYTNGIRFEIIEQGETWCKVYGSASGNIGYLMTAYLKIYGLGSPVKTIQNGNTYVNFRSQPNQTSSAVYQKLYSGTVVTVLTPGDEWTQIRYGNTTGYVMSSFLK